MKKFLIIFSFMITNYYGNAQATEGKVIGHYLNSIYLLKGNNYYIVERIDLKRYNRIERDTLIPTSSATDTFSGNKYFLYLKKDKQYLAYKEHKRPIMKLKSIDQQILIQRVRKYNSFYYGLQEEKFASYLRQLKQSNNMNMYWNFLHELDMRREIDELSIEDFKHYVDEFVEKYGLKSME